MAKLTGTNPDQVPTNADLGTMAYQDKDNLQVGNIAVTGTVDGRDIATNIPAALGAAGQVLSVNEGETAAEWADPSGGGGTETVGTVTGNATLDLSTGTVFSHTPTSNTTFTFSNPPASGTAQGFTLKIVGANVSDGYDIANASYDSTSYASGQSNQSGLVFKPDGTQMYITDFSLNSIRSHNLSTAWDVSTASFSYELSLSSQDSNPFGVVFKPDGTKMYMAGQSNTRIYQYSLSTAWNISTASYDSVSFSVSANSSAIRGLFIKPDGTKMYITSAGNSAVNEYDLSTAWDVSSASYSTTFSISSYTPFTQLVFTPDGTRMLTTQDGTLNRINQFSLSTAWDVSTASYDSVSFSVGTQEDEPMSLAFKTDGSKMYVAGGSNPRSVYQYTTVLAAPATFTYPSSVKFAAGTAPDAPDIGETDVLAFYTEDGGTTYYGFQAGDAMA